MRPNLRVMFMTRKILQYSWALVVLWTIVSCRSVDRIRIDLPADWEEAWILYSFPLNETHPTAQVDTLIPTNHRLSWTPSQTDSLELILIPASQPRYNRQGSAYKIQLYFTQEDRIHAQVTGNADAFRYTLKEGNRLNREVCTYTNLVAPNLEAERVAMNRLYEIFQQERKEKIRIDTLLAPARDLHIANRNFAVQYYKEHARDLASGHYWLQIFSAEAIPMESLMPYGVRNGLLKHRIDARMYPEVSKNKPTAQEK